jgi:hypothetical protein
LIIDGDDTNPSVLYGLAVAEGSFGAFDHNTLLANAVQSRAADDWFASFPVEESFQELTATGSEPSKPRVAATPDSAVEAPAADQPTSVVVAEGASVEITGPGTQSATFSGTTGTLVIDHSIGAGATLELTSAYSGTVSFAGATGTLIIDHSSSFSGTITGQLAIGNLIDLKDITAGGNATISYSGNNSPGTLTVSDGTHTANIALDGIYSLANFTASSDGHGGTIVVDPPVLPAGVTLKPIDGGSNYYGDHGLTYAHNAGWDSPSFIPIGVWLAGITSQSDANRWHDLSLNTMFGMTSDTPLSLLRANGIDVLIQQTELSTILANNGGSLGSESVGLLSYDEASTYQQGVSGPISNTANSVQDGRFWWMNNTWNWIEYGALNGGPATTTAQLYTPVATPNGTTRHIDASSVDFYWFAATGSSLLYEAGLLEGLSGAATLDQAQRGSNYGDMISAQEAATGGNSPIYAYIENGGPYLEDTSASNYITPAELNWAAWSSLIHGAEGIIYFNHTFAGPAQSDDNLALPFYQTVQPGQTVSIYTQTKETDALVEQMAPVLKSPTALGYVTVNNAGYENGTVVSQFSGIETTAKDYNGQFYIFADTRDSMTQTNISATFTIADLNATSVTVVNENRTIAVTNGVFSDTFATAATVHIYEVNDSGTPGPTPISIVESPSSGDLNAGNTVTLTLNLSSTVTVAGGTPTLTLNDGGTATYMGGSGTSALTFSYTVGAGQNTAALAATAVNLNGATVKDGSGNAANFLLNALTQTGPQIDTTTPVISAIAESPANGALNAGKIVTYTITMNEVVTVNTTGGSPTLTFNDGGTATYVSGSGTNALTFSYTVLAGQNTPDLMVSAVNLNGATLRDGAGNAGNLSLTGVSQGSPQIDTTPPSVTQVIASPANGTEFPGNTVTFTLAFGEAVTVTGTPTLTLNDGGTATYLAGTGTNALTFTYTVGSGDATGSALAITQANLPNGATITDGAGNAANLSGALTTFPNLAIGVDQAPVVTTSTQYMMRSQSIAASSLFTATDPDGNPIKTYALKDPTGFGHFVVNGVIQASNTEIDLTAAQLAQTSFVTGSGTDQLSVRASDGWLWSNWQSPAVNVSTTPVINAGATLELASAYPGQVTFASTTGTLKLDNSASFAGTVAGMVGSDTLDLADINFATTGTPSFSGTSTGGTLTVTDGSHTANIALMGNYIASTFTVSSDGHSGTFITDAPTTSPILSPPHGHH